MSASQMITIDNWQQYKADVEALLEGKVTEFVEGLGATNNIGALKTKTGSDYLNVKIPVRPHGTVMLALVEGLTEINTRLVAKQTKHGEVYHSDSDTNVHADGVSSEGQILQKTEQLIQQAGKRALTALTRELGHEKQRDLVGAVASSVGDVSEEERTPEDLDTPAKIVLGRTRANDYIPADDPWHLRFVLQGLKQMKEKLSAEDTISDITLDIETPEEAERFDWLASAFGRYSYLAHYYDGPQGIVQKANEHTDEHDYQVELRRAVEWEAEQIGFYLENVLGKNYGRFYEYLDRETDQIDRVEQ